MRGIELWHRIYQVIPQGLWWSWPKQLFCWNNCLWYRVCGTGFASGIRWAVDSLPEWLLWQLESKVSSEVILKIIWLWRNDALAIIDTSDHFLGLCLLESHDCSVPWILVCKEPIPEVRMKLNTWYHDDFKMDYLIYWKNYLKMSTISAKQATFQLKGLISIIHVEGD